MTSLRLLAVLNAEFKMQGHGMPCPRSLSGARLVLTGLSRTSPRHLVRKAG